MGRIAKFLAGAALVAGALGTAPIATSAPGTPVYPQPPVPVIQSVDCFGETGGHGCGPGYHWRDGWHGPGCYPC